MASSRWKRFAFFDRHTLSLPNEVVDDLISADIRNGSTTTADRAAGTLSSSRKNDQQQQHLGLTCDSIRLVVTSAALPASSSTSNAASSQRKADFATLPSTPHNAGDLVHKMEQQLSLKDEDEPMTAMWSTLMACAAPDISSSPTKKDSADGSKQQSNEIRLPSQSQASMPFMASSSSSNPTTTTSLSRASSSDGLVLVFCTSPNSDLIHCVDVTVRCNPSSAAATAAGGESLEDLDGWRGYFAPFSSVSSEDSIHTDSVRSSSRMSERPGASSAVADHGAGGGGSSSVEDDIHNTHWNHLQGLAVCRAESSASVHDAQGSSSQQQEHNPILMACLSESMVVLHEDPHLHLSCRLPLANHTPNSLTSSTSTPPYATWNTTQYGYGRVVDILLPGIVAVGTSKGTVLVFNAMKTTPHNKLQLFMTIPPPPSLSSDKSSTSNVVGVTSVKLVMGGGTGGNNATNTKMFLYVSYYKASSGSGIASSPTRNRRSMPSSPSSNSATGGGGGAAAGGVCCYDLGNVPTNNNNNSHHHGPLARFDLDGRHVRSDSLCNVIEKYDGSSGSTASQAKQYMVAQPDGLYTYSQTQKVGVAPIDGSKISICALPQIYNHGSSTLKKKRHSSMNGSGSGTATSSGGTTSAGGGTTVIPDAANTSSTTSTTASGVLYALVASTDAKSGRDAIDIYDATNKLVAFHVLLSPGHRALRAVAIATLPKGLTESGMPEGGRSSAIVVTSGGSIVTLTEKVTRAKVSLLVQKNLYAAAISMAFADPSYQPSDITALYRRHAEHLYRKGDFSAAMDQYIYTIGSLESSHVIYRYLDAPKIPLLARYLEELRSRNLATSVHNELLRACYLKLNDTPASEKVSATLSSSTDAASLSSIVSNLATQNPTEALATICSFKAPQAAEALVKHGAALVRVMPRETAGIVVSLCVGTYSPMDIANAADAANTINTATSGATAGGGEASATTKSTSAASKLLEHPPTTFGTDDDRPKTSEPYPVHLFASAFLENPKLLRLILAHCNRNKCPLTPSLRRTLLELTLAEWNHAKRTGDTEVEKMRRKEAIASLTDSHSADIGDYEALVLVQQANFAEGELLIYERLQMVPMLLARYAQDGGERARRQMLAMCQSDPEILADVLGYFVNMASVAISQEGGRSGGRTTSHSLVGGAARSHYTNSVGGSIPGRDDDSLGSSDGEASEILDDIREALTLARVQGVLPPVRIARILAGEGVGQFSVDSSQQQQQQQQHMIPQSYHPNATSTPPSGANQLTVPLSVALDYVGAILDDTSKESSRLKSEVEEYNELCASMESEIESLLSAARPTSPSMAACDSKEQLSSIAGATTSTNIDIEEIYTKLRSSVDDGISSTGKRSDSTTTTATSEQSQEAFWREMGGSEDRFETITRFFAKGIVQ